MKGIIFTELLEMVEMKYGFDFADDLIDSAQLDSGGSYTAVGNYPDHEIVRLVGILSEKTGMPPRDLLMAYGDHLFAVFASRFKDLIVGAKDSLQFLSLVDSYIHPEVKKLYPDAAPPRFIIESKGDDFMVMQYQSERCMADLAEGLMAATFRHFGEAFESHREELSEDGARVRFTLRRSKP